MFGLQAVMRLHFCPLDPLLETFSVSMFVYIYVSTQSNKFMKLTKWGCVVH